MLDVSTVQMDVLTKLDSFEKKCKRFITLSSTTLGRRTARISLYSLWVYEPALLISTFYQRIGEEMTIIKPNE